MKMQQQWASRHANYWHLYYFSHYITERNRPVDDW